MATSALGSASLVDYGTSLADYGYNNPNDPRKKGKKERRAQREAHQPDKSDGFAQWFTEDNADGQYDEKLGKYTSGKYRGKTRNEAKSLARDEFAALNQSTPGFADKWRSRARGDDVSQGPRAMGQLPENMRGMPNTPDLSGFQQFDKQGRQVAGPSPSARQRFMDSVNQGAVRAQTAKQAVQDRKAWQAANPGAVADMSIAARDAQLAESGITDMGGGTKAMSNKYGTGFATPMTAKEAADRKAGKTFGTIIDEKGVVDVKGMMANKDTGTTTPYQPGTTEMGEDGRLMSNASALNMDARDANRADIQSKIAAAIPGAEERRAADRAKVIETIKSAVPAPAVASSMTPARTSPLPGVGGMATPNLTPGEARKREVKALPLGADMASKAIYNAKMYGAGKPPAAAPAVSAAPPPAVEAPKPPVTPATSQVAPKTRPAVAKVGRDLIAPIVAPAPESPQMKAMKTNVSNIPSNITAGLQQSYDGMKRTIFGS